MLGIGAAEFLILVLLAVLLFGAPVLTFIVGYSLGKKRSESPPVDPDAAAPSARSNTEE